MTDIQIQLDKLVEEKLAKRLEEMADKIVAEKMKAYELNAQADKIVADKLKEILPVLPILRQTVDKPIKTLPDNTNAVHGNAKPIDKDLLKQLCEVELLTDKQIADKLGNISEALVDKYRGEYGISNYNVLIHTKRLEFYNQGMTANEIAKAMNESRSTIYNWQITEGLATNPFKTKTEKVKERKDKLEELVNNGLTVGEIASELKTTTPTIRHWLENYGIVKPMELKYKKIIELNAQGVSVPEIANIVNMNLNSLYVWMRNHHIDTNNRFEINDKKRKELYEKGLSVGEIANELCEAYSTTQGWADRNGLLRTEKARLHQLVSQQRMDLVKQGKNYPEIAKIEGVPVNNIRAWASNNNLPLETEIDHKKRLDLYNQGKTAREIAEALGERRNLITAWINRNGLKPHKKSHISETVKTEIDQFNAVHSLDLSSDIKPIRDCKPFQYLADKVKVVGVTPIQEDIGRGIIGDKNA